VGYKKLVHEDNRNGQPTAHLFCESFVQSWNIRRRDHDEKSAAPSWIETHRDIKAPTSSYWTNARGHVLAVILWTTFTKIDALGRLPITVVFVNNFL